MENTLHFQSVFNLFKQLTGMCPKRKMRLRKLTDDLTLYRYRPINSFTLLELRNSNVWLSNPKSFNDPFDSKIRVSSQKDKMLLEKMSDWLRKENAIKKKSSYYSFDDLMIAWGTFDEESKSHLCPIASDQISYALEASDGSIGEILNFLNKEGFDDSTVNLMIAAIYKIGIVCLSESGFEPNMWAHYADNHRGICIRYKLSQVELKKSGLKHMTVTYSNTEPALICDDEHEYFEPKFLQQIAQKSEVWKYEREYRLIAMGKSETAIQFPGEITGVCFGMRTPKHEKDLITSFPIRK